MQRVFFMNGKAFRILITLKIWNLEKFFKKKNNKCSYLYWDSVYSHILDSRSYNIETDFF